MKHFSFFKGQYIPLTVSDPVQNLSIAMFSDSKIAQEYGYTKTSALVLYDVNETGGGGDKLIFCNEHLNTISFSC